jgi:shikimate kinase
MVKDIKPPKSIVLIGMMGVGKTSIGRKLSKHLNVHFTDSDHEVEQAAQCTISDIFEIYGEEAFLDVERRVISRLLDETPHVIATGGSAFADPVSQEIIKNKGISIWLKASVETILPRIERRDHRPQFAGVDTREKLEELMNEYTPLYAKSDITVDCSNSTPDATTERIILELNRFLSKSQIESGTKIHHG